MKPNIKNINRWPAKFRKPMQRRVLPLIYRSPWQVLISLALPISEETTQLDHT